MTFADIVLLVGLIALMSPFIWMVTRAGLEKGCPECGSHAVHKSEELYDAHVYAFSSCEASRPTAQERFIVHHRCVVCKHEYKTTMTRTR